MPGWVEIIIRSIVFLTVLFFMTKLLGQKQLTQLSVFEYIFGIVIGGIVAIHASTLKSTFMHGFIAMVILFFVAFVIEFISIKNKTFRDFFMGKSTVLIKDGKIMEDNMKKVRYSADDLLENMRGKDVFKIADVEFAVLEPNGIINVLPKTENQPLTPKDMGMNLPQRKEPQTVVMDGKMLLEPLADQSLNPNWLETELDKMNIAIENVFLGQVDSSGQLTVDLFDDQIEVPLPSEKPLLLATLKKCQADLELFALATDNKQTEAMYRSNSKKAQHIINLLSPYLK
jgi:uncharacterized membrane protein YcaP (DUF421 family)